ncbi:hypothetical protein [Lusitaniella coriacea]|uniref:hypothetical protein n=1 Tax=Lusitaniella coriacea TaxID=1983105 RepID=UPI003CEC37AA
MSSRNTKAEILEAFEELKKEKATLEAQMKQRDRGSNLPATTSATKNPPQDKPTVEKIETKDDSKTMNKARISQIVRDLEQLQIGFGGAASNLSEQLIAEASQFEELQQFIQEETQKLSELHDLEEIAEDTLETLIETYEENAKTFGEERSERQETLEQQIEDLRKAWQKEREIHQREIKERNESHQTERQREEDEYQYNLALELILSEEEYEQRKKLLYQELTEERQGQEKVWEERESSILEQEKQYSEVKYKVEIFEGEKEKSVKRGKEIGKNIGQHQAKVKADLRAKEVEGTKQNYQLQIQSLEQTIHSQESRLQSLAKQLDFAQKQVQDLAVKAIEGTSNLNSFEAIKEIALEQAKTPQKNK